MLSQSVCLGECLSSCSIVVCIYTHHCNKSKISCIFAPKEMCRKHNIIEQIFGSLHEIQLYNVHLLHIS